MKEIVLKLDSIVKEFPGVKALDGAKLNLYKGKVMGLLGENGAGKSTLMKVIAGIYAKDAGTVEVFGEQVEFKNPKEAQDKGIAIIHQELNFIPQLTIGENIFLGREFKKAGKIDWNKLFAEADKVLGVLGVEHSARELMENISIGQQQMVEIAKAISQNAQIIIMDEPTDALTDGETNKLFQVIRQLKAEGKSIVYISHRLKEIFEICDDITILRDGIFISEAPVKEVDEEYIIRNMVGRSLGELFPNLKVEPGEVALEIVDGFNEHLKGINLSVKKGEVLGISGLMGAGRTELAKTIYGAYPLKNGHIKVLGKRIKINSPEKAIQSGIAYVSEDRKKDGLILGLSISDNMTLSSLKKLERKNKTIDKKREATSVQEFIDKFKIKTPSKEQLIKNLSGGNQQKVAIAKALMSSPKILILDEPTRGVDVGAKKEIYELINSLKKEGLCIIVISSEMPEIMGLSDRIIVLHENKVTGSFAREDVTQEKLMRSAVGIEEETNE